MAVVPKPEPELLVVADVGAFRAWLDEFEDVSDGVWLVLAKKGVTEPTSLRYEEALDEALCSGWIDGQVKRIDDRVYRQRFTPRRKRSIWSKRNVEKISVLTAEGRLRPRGLVEVERAKADGRWDNAYSGPATIRVPDDLAAALAAHPAAAAVFETLSGQNRYAVLHRIETALRPETRAKRIARSVEQLAAGVTPY